jgi:hypothetical protein
VIVYLIEHSNLPREELRLAINKEFRGVLGGEVVENLIEKFTKLKKTKEELIKYCMRKAFKFIL